MRFFFCFALALTVLPARGQDPDSVMRENPIAVGGHDDEGPADRYRVPYDPITYGQRVRAPLPGLAYAYKLHDWDGDGRIDLLANLRRGGGIVFYRNVGSEKEPTFRSLQENEVLLPRGDMGRYFDFIDLEDDGQTALVAFDYGRRGLRTGGGPLAVYFNDGSPEAPRWRKVYARSPSGDSLFAAHDVHNAPRVEVVDWDGDGLEDLILGYEHNEEMLPLDRRQRRSSIGGFHDPEAYNAESGYVGWMRGFGIEGGRPVFAEAEPLLADGEPITTYVHPYPTVFDVDGDGRPDLLVGTHRAEVRVFLNRGTAEEPALTDVGLLQDERGEPLRTFLTIRVEAADLDGDGTDEFVGTSYFGNADRYLVYERASEDGMRWRTSGYLALQAEPDTPVYGMGNSTVDPVDFDGDGDLDLLLGAEGSFPTVVRNVGSDTARVYEPAERLRYVDGSFLETFSIEEGDGSHWGPLEWYSDRIAPRARDWDGDGVLDLVSGSMGRRLYFFKGRVVDDSLRFERPQNFRFGSEELVLPDRLFPALLDWTGDGRLDVMVSNDPGHVLVYPGSGTLDLGEPIRLDHPDGSPIVLEDFWSEKKATAPASTWPTGTATASATSSSTSSTAASFYLGTPAMTRLKEKNSSSPSTATSPGRP